MIPVATKNTLSPHTRSSVVRTLSRSCPASIARCRSSSSLGHSLPWMVPPRHLMVIGAATLIVVASCLKAPAEEPACRQVAVRVSLHSFPDDYENSCLDAGLDLFTPFGRPAPVIVPEPRSDARARLKQSGVLDATQVFMFLEALQGHRQSRMLLAPELRLDSYIRME